MQSQPKEILTTKIMKATKKMDIKKSFLLVFSVLRGLINTTDFKKLPIAS